MIRSLILSAISHSRLGMDWTNCRQEAKKPVRGQSSRSGHWAFEWKRKVLRLVCGGVGVVEHLFFFLNASLCPDTLLISLI